MPKRPTLPRTARDWFEPSPQTVLSRAVAVLADLTGIWEYPMRCRGDVADMRLVDKVYWYYKAARPVRRARRGSGIEAYFDERSDARAELPAGFQIERELTLSGVGDLMNHAFLARSRDTLYEQVNDLVFGADVSMANLECVIEPPVQREPVISFDKPPPLYYDAAAFTAASGALDKRYRLLAGACNHSLDFGEAGVDSTLRRMEIGRAHV